MGFSQSKPEPEEKIIKRYGWIRDEQDPSIPFHDFDIFPRLGDIKLVDLRYNCPPVYSQGDLGSCTANAMAAAYEYDQIKAGEKNPFVPSRLFIYWNERKIQGTINEDSGARISIGMKAVNNFGVCPESMWPYHIKDYKKEPNQECYDTAKNHTCIEHKKIKQELFQVKQCLFLGLPFVFGVDLYESFDNVDASGIVPLPDLTKEKQIGGHAMVCVGFDDQKQLFIVRNSWGPKWGDKGYCYFPYAYLLNKSMASDFWSVQKIRDV